MLGRPDQRGGGRLGRRPGEAAHQHDRRPLIGLPCTSEAAAAISSAKPVSVTSSLRPNRSGWPRQSISAGNPAAPSAIPTVPRRNGRPKLSLTTIARRLPHISSNRRCKARAEASGSSGSSSTRSLPSDGATFEWSIPALAITQPRRCSAISRLGRCRTMRRDSERITSTSRGSFSTSAASAMARSDGSTVATSTARSSALETIFWATTSTSPSAGASPLAA